jgi:hypothetical protein
MRQYPMTLSAGVKLVTGLVVLLLCATPVVVWSLSPGILIGGPRGPAGPVVQGRVGGLFGYSGWFYGKRFVDGLLASAPRARLRQPGAAGAASATRTS